MAPTERNFMVYSDNYWHETFDFLDENGDAVVLGESDTVVFRISKTLDDSMGAREDITLVSSPDILVDSEAGELDLYVYDIGIDPGRYRYALFHTTPSLEMGVPDTVFLLYVGALVVERSVADVPAYSE